MRASLPMYALPGLEAATEAWWAGLAAAFRAEGLAEVPRLLQRLLTELEEHEREVS